MHSKALVATLISAILLLSAMPMVAFAPQPPINPDELILGSIGLPYRADPATAYDTGSGSLIMNIYEPLIDFARDKSEPPQTQGKIDQFVPRLAVALPTKQVFLMHLISLTPINQSNPECTYWEDIVTGEVYHINGWRDNNPEKPYPELGPCDVVYMEEVDPGTHMPIPCTKFMWHVQEKWHDGPLVHIIVKRTWYIFKLRTGVPIHPWKYYNGMDAPCANLTCEDVEYYFERALVQDRLYGPTWMFYKPILDAMNVDDLMTGTGLDSFEVGRLIDCAFQQNCTHFFINVGIDFPETAWYQILAQTWGAIVPKAFSINHGCWPQIWANATHAIWKLWRRWPTLTRSPLDRAPTTLTPPGVAAGTVTPPPGWTGSWAGHAEPAPVLRGTGPYYQTGIGWDTVLNQWRIDWFKDTRCGSYWGGWAPYDCHPYFVKTYKMRNIEDWSVRYDAFMVGDIDVIAVPRAYMTQLLTDPEDPTSPPLPGIKCYKDILTLVSDSLHFQFVVTDGSAYMPTIGGAPTPAFFSNEHARKAFAYALNFTKLIKDAWWGEAEQPATPLINNLSPDFRKPEIKKYDIDLAMVRYHLKNANFSGVPLWESGFKTTLVYNLGNDQRKIACDMIALAIEGLNAERGVLPPFDVDVVGLPWSPDYLEEMEMGYLPVFQIGWLADFADADNWIRPYMHTYGDFSHIQGYSNPAADLLIDLAVKTPDVDPTITKTIENTTAVPATGTPNCTYWHETAPTPSLIWHICNWIDGWKGKKDGKLSICDAIKLNCTEWWHVKNMTQDPVTKKITLELERSKRTDMYVQLQYMWIADCPTLMIVQPMGRAWMRTWVQGWYDNALFPGAPIRDRWKGYVGDLNRDLCVDIFDLVIVAAEFGKPPPPITDPRADINKDGVVDIFDIVIVAAEFGSGCL